MTMVSMSPRSASEASVRVSVLQGLSQRRHILPVQPGHLGVEQRRRLLGVLELCLQLFPAGVERLDLGFTLVHHDLVVEHQV